MESPSTSDRGQLRVFEVRAFRYLVPSATSRPPVNVGIIVCNADEAWYAQPAGGNDWSYRVTLTNQPNGTDMRIDGTQWGVNIKSEFCSMIEGAQTISLSGPYPQPLSLQRGRRVFIPCTDVALGTRVSLTLLTLGGVSLLSATSSVVLDDDRIVAAFDLDGDLVPGTYLVRAETERTSSLCKVLIQR